MTDMTNKPALRMLLVIVDKESGKKVTDIIQHSPLHLHFQWRAQGTASSDVLDLLGVGRTDKVLTLCLAPKVIIDPLLASLKRKLRLALPGRGIAFTLPLSGIGNPVYRLLNEEIRDHIECAIEGEGEKMTSTATHDLIMAVINRGYSEDLMDAARTAGARGGTVIHARRVGGEDPIKLWGITVQEEKEIVMIVAKREDKVEIMKAIGKHCGIQSEAQGFVFALPVDAIEGLEYEDAEDDED